ncbi:MAG TPA: NAD(P)H-hydrate dehydratase, partial [Bacillota bacterium]|nr:NAD(P)H-hydrate dehydratase [Bacillota bacterium]
KADDTVTFGYAKPGLFLGSGKDNVGRLTVADIGVKASEINIRLAEPDDFSDILCERKNNSNKGTYGTVALFGGCIEYSGALKLANASCAAMRAGCGICRVVTNSAAASSVAPHLMESTLFILEEKGGVSEIGKALHGVKAVAAGMGWGTRSDKAEILQFLLESDLPLIIDADGLNTLSAAPQLTALLGKNTILTPHPAEFARLCGTDTAQILADPVGCAVTYAREHSGCCILLKGTSTVVTNGEKTYICNRGCPGMATAGSGDVLSGVILGLLGWNRVFVKTALCGAYISGLAGEYAQQEMNSISMIASDTIKMIPKAITHMM